jgi:hypothetical protein
MRPRRKMRPSVGISLDGGYLRVKLRPARQHIAAAYSCDGIARESRDSGQHLIGEQNERLMA